MFIYHFHISFWDKISLLKEKLSIPNKFLIFKQTILIFNFVSGLLLPRKKLFSMMKIETDKTNYLTGLQVSMAQICTSGDN